MKLGFQWITARSIPVRVEDFFSCEVLLNGAIADAATGLDQYGLDTIILPDKRLAGSGRKCIYTDRELICGLGNLQARPFSYCELAAAWNLLELRLQTNRLLDYRELPLLLELEIWWIDSDREHSRRFHLQNPLLRIDWEERGSYRLDITHLARYLFPQIAGTVSRPD